MNREIILINSYIALKSVSFSTCVSVLQFAPRLDSKILSDCTRSLSCNICRVLFYHLAIHSKVRFVLSRLLWCKEFSFHILDRVLTDTEEASSHNLVFVRVQFLDKRLIQIGLILFWIIFAVFYNVKIYFSHFCYIFTWKVACNLPGPVLLFY